MKAKNSPRIVEGRKNIISEAENQINNLEHKVERLIKGKESEYLFSITSFFPNLFASLIKGRQITRTYKVCNIGWLRATNELTLALNKILPKFLPLKHPKMLNHSKLEKTFKENLLALLDTCWKIGVWYYYLENKYINKIIVEKENVKPYYLGDKTHIFQEYVDKVAVSEEYAHWFEWVHKKVLQNPEIAGMIDEYLKREHGFGLNDIKKASEYLENLVEKGRLMIPNNEVHTVFTKNIRSYRAEKLLRQLTFGRGSDLYKSPLIPLRGGYFLIAGWVFSMAMHFESWIRPAIESTKIYGKYSDLVGKSFEKYVESQIISVADKVRPNITIDAGKYPEIKPWLDRLKKEDRFEIDMLATKENVVFVISCKGGKKELPKLRISKMWGEFQQKEILDRVKENKKEIEEIAIECKCIASNERICKDLCLGGKKLVPVAVYSIIQPLSLPKLKEFYGVPPDMMVLTPNGLKNLIATSL